MRIVIDTNLLVSGVISAGLPRQLVDAAKAGEFELCTSEVLLAELLDVIARSGVFRWRHARWRRVRCHLKFVQGWFGLIR